MSAAALEALEVLALDCQVTGPDPSRSHLLEVGWGGVDGQVASSIVKLLDGAKVPERVLRVTGMSRGELSFGLPPEEIWRLVSSRASEVAEANQLPLCSAVVHFASLEERYLKWLHYRASPETRFPFHFLCTHRIARRLFPDLPRKSLRAVAGYLGYGLAESRRTTEHVRATLAVWHALVALLREREGITTLGELFDWLRAPLPRRARSRSYPMPTATRRELPSRPGVYRMLRANGDVLYVGKAASVRERVSSYFRPSAKHPEHTLEMLSQARDVGFTETRTALEAALLESDEIKRIDPPYNRALRKGVRRLVFATRGLDGFAETAERVHRVGPLLDSKVLPAICCLRDLLAGGEPERPERALALSEGWAPEREDFRTGIEMWRAELGGMDPLAFGTRLWRKEDGGEPAEEAFELEAERGSRGRSGPEAVAARLSEVVRHAAHLVRRAHWHALVSESTLTWRSRSGALVALVLEGGCPHPLRELDEGDSPPPPPAAGRAFTERRKRFDLEGYDRMTVLTKEMRRLLLEGRDPLLKLGPGVALEGPKLGRLLSWI